MTSVLPVASDTTNIEWVYLVPLWTILNTLFIFTPFRTFKIFHIWNLSHYSYLHNYFLYSKRTVNENFTIDSQGSESLSLLLSDQMYGWMNWQALFLSFVSSLCLIVFDGTRTWFSAELLSKKPLHLGVFKSTCHIACWVSATFFFLASQQALLERV